MPVVGKQWVVGCDQYIVWDQALIFVMQRDCEELHVAHVSAGGISLWWCCNLKVHWVVLRANVAEFIVVLQCLQHCCVVTQITHA
jgi:hypothetical protein